MSTTPVISKTAYVAAFRDWFLAAPQHSADLVKPLTVAFERMPEGVHPVETFCAIGLEEVRRMPGGNPMPIWKSNYLYRRIYLHQRHRLNPCPTCEGHHDIYGSDRSCPLCGSTGWLP